jgi:hypothetical protein
MRPGFINSFMPARDPVVQTPPLPSDYWHVSNANYAASAFLPQQSYPFSVASFGLNTINNLFAVPFFVGRLGRTVTALGARWVTAPAAGAIFKIGIYDVLPASAHNVYPQNRVASVEFTLTGSTGVQTGTLSSPVNLPNGLYWIAFARRSGLSGTIRCLNGGGFNQMAGRNPLQWTGSALGVNTYLQVALPDASALPATFAAGATIQTGTPQLLEVL